MHPVLSFLLNMQPVVSPLLTMQPVISPLLTMQPVLSPLLTMQPVISPCLCVLMVKGHLTSGVDGYSLVSVSVLLTVPSNIVIYF